MHSFMINLFREMGRNLRNSYSAAENWDSEVLGEAGKGTYPKLYKAAAQKLRKLLKLSNELKLSYNLLSDDESKKLYVSIFAYFVLGYRKVKLPLNTPAYWDARRKPLALIDDQAVIRAGEWTLQRFDLNKVGFPVRLFCSASTVTHSFILRHYDLIRGAVRIKAEAGDYVIDAGGCWGDTALYFANEVGDKGKVYVFEFVPDNLKIMQENIELNPACAKRIEIVKSPMDELSDTSLFCTGDGPSSTVHAERRLPSDFEVKTLSIDDFVIRNNIEKIDFVKMDIEGMELPSLRGARKTIEKFKPKLAISLYHSLDDYVTIPIYLASLSCNYIFFISHCTIHQHETVLFAIAADQLT